MKKEIRTNTTYFNLQFTKYSLTCLKRTNVSLKLRFYTNFKFFLLHDHILIILILLIIIINDLEIN